MSERERQERVKEIERKIAELEADQSAETQWGAAVGAREEWLKALRAERDRLLQGECAHSTDDGRCLFATRDWSEGCKPQRCPDCPGDTLASTPAEPNPPGSGEPVGWRTAMSICRAFANWNYERIRDEADTVFAPAANAANDCADLIERYARDGNLDGTNLEGLALYAAPLPSPSEGAVREAEMLRRRFAEYLVPAYLENRCAIAALCDEELDRTGELLGLVREAARTRATATGGGDNG